MKKISALCVLVSLLLITCVQVNVLAYNEPDSWNYTYEEGKTIDRTRNYIDISEKYFSNGAASVYTAFPDYYDNNTYIEAKNNLSSELDGAAQISFKVKGSISKKYTSVFVGEEELFLNSEKWTTLSENGWTKYSASVEVSSAEVFAIRFYGYTNGCAIDEVSVKCADTEYIINGDFEAYHEYVEAPDEPDDSDEPDEPDNPDDSGNEGYSNPYVPTAYEPTRVVMFSAGNTLAPSWVNPSSGTLTRVSLYDITDGEILIKDDFSIVPSALVKYKISGLKNARPYQFKIVCEFSDYPDVEYLTGGIPSPSGNSGSFGSWSKYLGYSTAKGFCPADIMYDNTVYRSGAVSLRFDCNINGVQSNVASQINQTVPLEEGKNYKFSFWAKAENNPRGLIVHVSYAPNDNGGIQMSNSTGTYDWKKFEFTMTDFYVSGEPRLYFTVDQAATVWVDDFEIYEMVDGVTVGENLIGNGSFEESYSTETNDIVEIKEVTPGDGCVYIKWKIPQKNYNGLRVYNVVDGKQLLLGNVNKGAESFELTHLENNKKYTYLLKPYNSSMVEGEGVVVEFTPIAPDYKIYEPGVYKNDVRLEGMESGLLEIVTEVKNNKMGEDFSIMQAVGLYSGDELIQFETCGGIIEQTPDTAAPVRLASKINVPDDGKDYYLKIFTWDSIAERNVVKPCVDFK